MGEIYWPWRGNQLKDEDVQAVGEALREIDADVVLLQELGHGGQLEQLCEQDGYVGALPGCCGYDRHVGVLVRRALSPVFDEHLLAPTSRGVVEARFEWACAGVPLPVRALSLHFDVFRPARRLLQARAAAELIGDPGTLTIAGGDLNYDPVASARLGREHDAETEAVLSERMVDVAARVGPTLVGFLRVDRLFAGGTALRRWEARAAAHRLPLGDHAPIVCDLECHRDDAQVDGAHADP